MKHASVLLSRAVAAFVGLLLLLLLASAPARAQIDSREGIVLKNQIAELRHELELLREQIGNGAAGGGASAIGAAPPPAAEAGGPNELVAQLLGRVERLEDEVRSLRGRIDEVDNARQREAEDLGKQLGDLAFKVGGGVPPPAAGAPGSPDAAPPQAGGPTPLSPPPASLAPPALSPPPRNLAQQVPGAPAPAAPPPPPAPAPPPRRTPELILLEGNAALARKDYSAAEAAAKAVLALGGPRMADAQLLAARAAFGKRDYASAAIAYDDTYKRSPNGAHAQDARLGLAASLAALGDKKAACGALEKLAIEFPTLRPDLRPTAASVRREAGCRAPG
jgi:TolA-binding protein